MIDYWRQLDFVTPKDLSAMVNVIGVGGLGSPIALAIAKMGCPRITLFDDDHVEPHNLPNQLYRMRDLDKPKVLALAEMLREYVPAEIEAIAERVTDRAFHGIVISAVDSMAARRMIWENCIRYRAPIDLYIDARMGGEVGRVLTLAPTSPIEVAAYEETLFGDDEATLDPCTAQSTIYATFGIAALVANQVKRHARAQSLIFDHVLDFSTSTLLAYD